MISILILSCTKSLKYSDLDLTPNTGWRRYKSPSQPLESICSSSHTFPPLLMLLLPRHAPQPSASSVNVLPPTEAVLSLSLSKSTLVSHVSKLLTAYNTPFKVHFTVFKIFSHNSFWRQISLILLFQDMDEEKGSIPSLRIHRRPCCLPLPCFSKQCWDSGFVS